MLKGGQENIQEPSEKTTEIIDNSNAWYLYYYNSFMHKAWLKERKNNPETKPPHIKTNVSRRERKQVLYVSQFRKCIDEINATFACFLYFISTFKFKDEAYIFHVLIHENEQFLNMLHGFFLYSLFKDLIRNNAKQICQNRIRCEGRSSCYTCKGDDPNGTKYYKCPEDVVTGSDLWECKTHMFLERAKQQFSIQTIIDHIYKVLDEWWFHRERVIVDKLKRSKCSDVYSTISDKDKNMQYCKIKKAEKKCNSPKKNTKNVTWRNARAITEPYVTKVWGIHQEEAPSAFSNYKYSAFAFSE